MSHKQLFLKIINMYLQCTVEIFFGENGVLWNDKLVNDCLVLYK